MAFMTEAVSRAGGREINEDSYGFLEVNQSACWVVADGLGGHRGGETASRIAVDAALASFRAGPEFTAAALQRHLEAAQSAILQAQKTQPALSTMRTTIVMLLSDSQRVLWAHVGDSRLYWLKDGHIAFCTKDHSVVQAMVTAGELAASRIRHHEDRNRLLRCLGNEESDFRPTVETEARSLSGGAAFLLCTDGFWENVTEPEIEVDFAKGERTQDWLALMEGRLLERTTEDSDNYTAIAVRFEVEVSGGVSGGKSNVRAAKADGVDRARLARLGILGMLAIGIELVGLGAWDKGYALERQARDLADEQNALTASMKIQRQKAMDEEKVAIPVGSSTGAPRRTGSGIAER